MLTKKITLMGTPIPENKGRFRQAAALLTHPDLRLAFFSLSAALVATQVLPPQKVSFMESALTGIVLLGAHNFMEKKIVLPRFFSHPNKLAIDTQPAPDQQTDFEKYGHGITFSSGLFRLQAFGHLALVLGATAFIYAAINPIASLTAFFSAGPTCLHSFNSFRRWQKVTDGTWTLGDAPKLKEPVPVREKIKNLLTTPLPAPARN